MEYTRLGGTGLEVSRLCLGCMSFGAPDRGNHTWTLPEEQSRSIIKQALDAGINFLDTANVYSDGDSEEIVGRALKSFVKRDEVVLATKLCSRMRPGPNGAGLSRKAVMSEIDHSLRRLGTDYIDLYQIHRWDDSTPIEETMSALNDLVRAGKVRYLGASSMYAWQLSKALYTSRLHGWAEFVSMQNHVNLLYREEEREMLPLCADQRLGVLPWSPLARGRLARDPGQTTARTGADPFAGRMYDPTLDADRGILEAVGAIARERGASRAQVAMAWLLAKPGITSPIIGASRPQHLTEAIAALALRLTPPEIARLEEHYRPHPVTGIAVAAPPAAPSR
jgi:aryl-alcohol dehydrogenase-like predicted oxidoreductase